MRSDCARRAFVTALAFFSVARVASAQYVSAGVPPPAFQPIRERDIVFQPSRPDAWLELDERRDWRALCAGPCTVRAPIGSRLQVSGPEIPSSRPFRLYPNPGPLVVRADAGSRSARMVGLFLSGFGAFLAAGSITWGAERGAFGDRTDAAARQARFETAALLVGGTAIVLAGVWLTLSNKTRLHFGPPHPR